jgi:DNA repair protein RadC
MKIVESQIHYRIVQDGPPASVLDAGDAVNYVLDAMRQNPLQEGGWIITMNVAGEAISRHFIALGPMDGFAVHIRDILRVAILEGAYCFTFVHNHPLLSKAEPSLADCQAAQLIVSAGLLIRTTIYDMIIVAGPSSEGPQRAYSFRKAGWPDVVDFAKRQYRTGPEIQQIPALSADIDGRPYNIPDCLLPSPDQDRIGAS